MSFTTHGKKMRMLVHSAKQIVQVSNTRSVLILKEDLKDVKVFEARNGVGVSIAIDSCGNIAAIGCDDDVRKRFAEQDFEEVIDASGKCVIPGLVDAHTHPVWAGDRVHEFAMKLAGATYMDVHKAGGGINFTVEHTRKASEDELLQSLSERFYQMLRSGSTTVEGKSGYGLDTETEVKMLRVLEKVKKMVPLEISSTFCGAHAVPKGKTAEEATEIVITEQIPKIKELMEKKELNVENIDVFCEKGVFDTKQSERILQAGRSIGLRLNFHGDELHPMQSAEMGAKLRAEAISHLEEISEAGIEAMAQSKSVAVILPTTAFILRLRPPPVRRMIEAGIPVALGSDFNPNAFCLSMPVVMHLACVTMHMSMTEALCAATLNAAAALGRAHTHGSLELGKVGDLVIIDAPRWEHIIYRFGEHERLIEIVVKKGVTVFRRAAQK